MAHTRTEKTLRRACLVVALAFTMPWLHAASVLSVSPQGEANDVRQVVVRFDADMVPLGQSDGAEPASLACTPTTPEGRARWIGPRTWAFEFTQDLRGGTRCRVVFKVALKTLAGDTLAPPAPAGFVAGPSGFSGSHPAEGAEVLPDQIFLLRHHNPQPTADAAQLASRFTCEHLEGSQLVSQPAVAVTGAAVTAAARGAPSGTYALALRCAQPLPEGAAVRLRQAPEGDAAARLFNYRVRPPFTARLTCTNIDYPRGQQACDPRQPLTLAFTGSVATSSIGAIRLQGQAGETIASEASNQWQREAVSQLRVAPPPQGFGEGAQFTLALPADLRDTLGRPLANAGEFPKPVRFAMLPPYLGAANALAVMPWQAGRNEAAAVFAVRRTEKALALRQWRLGGEAGAAIEPYAIELLQRQQSGQWRADDLDARAGAARASRLATAGSVMEFVAAPLAAPGLHVVRADSAAFTDYLSTRAEAAVARPTAPSERYAVVQATNLNSAASLSDVGPSMVWVTALDTARPVAGADVAIYSCERVLLWRGKSNADGLADPGASLRGKLRCNAETRSWYRSGTAWVVVRAGNDMAVMPGAVDWSQPTAAWGTQPVTAHTVLDRALFKAGETVSMQHVVRLLDGRGFSLPTAATLDIEIRYGWNEKVHTSSVRLGADGNADSQWTIPLTAKLGAYSVALSQGGRPLAQTSFQVEEFRTPVFDSALNSAAIWEGDTQKAQVDARLSYFAGGAAAGWPVSVQHGWQQEVQSPRAGYDFYEEAVDMGRYEPATMPRKDTQLDARGTMRAMLETPPLKRPMLLQTELKFQDPSGETQTVGTAAMLWPDRMKLGLRLRAKDREHPQAVEGIALDEHNQPVADEPVTVRVKPVRRDWNNATTRLVDLGPEVEVCTARTDAQGQWSCAWQLPAAAEGQAQPAEQWLFDASAANLKHSRAIVHTQMLRERWSLGWREAQARTVLMVENSNTPELLFGPGETATVVARPERLPATLMLSTEREGVLAASVHSLTAMEQRIAFPITAEHAPNVHLRARYVYPLPAAGGDQPLASAQQAKLSVRPDAWTLAVDVRPAAANARPRTQVPVAIAVRDAANRPVGNARVTLVAVDQALLALRPNTSWALARAMFAERANAVTVTALDTRLQRLIELGPQPQLRPDDEADQGFAGAVPAPAMAAPAVAAAKIVDPNERDPSAPRRDMASLVLWRTDLRTDDQGMARASVPLNDALTQFRIVAIASADAHQFGEGEAAITSTQPLQIFSGLPEVLRADDAIVQKISLRNTGAAPLSVLLKAEAVVEARADWPGARQVVPADALAARGLKIERRISLAAGQSHDVLWPVAVPGGTDTLRWRISADGGTERDVLEIKQRVLPALETTVRQSTLLAVADARALAVVQPKDALPLAGGVRVALQASLVDAALAESTRWMSQYPYSCLEQQSSRYVALDDRAAWDRLMGQLPKYIDGTGLARYFPEPTLVGSEMLTVQLLDLAHAKDWPVPPLERKRMLDGLDALLQGRLAAQDWAPNNFLEPRQLAAQAALAEHGRAKITVRPKALAALSAQSLVDWSRTLMAMPADAARDRDLQLAGAQLRSRFDVQGTRLRWRDESAQHWWWFMWSGDSTAARLALLAQQWAATDAGWKADAPLITRGLVGRQDAGRWSTTTGNAWSTVALRRFQKDFEAGPVDGVTHATLGAITQDAPWSSAEAPTLLLPWPAQGAASTLRLRHEGSGKPWATISTLAAVRNTRAVSNGLVVKRTVTAVEQKRKGRWSVGDVYRVRLELGSTAEQTWVVVRDAVPSGASQLGRGLGRESQLAQSGQTTGGWAWPSYVERATDSYRAFFRYVPRGRWHVEYSVRLNNAGEFKLPPARAEAMYAPEIFAEGLAETMTVAP